MTNSSAPSASDHTSKTTISAETVTGSHVLEVKGYSATKGQLGVGKEIYSGVFSVGGHRWRLVYYPDGVNEESANHISIFVEIKNPVAKAEVKARACFSLLNNAPEDPVPRDDSFQIKFDLTVFKDVHMKTTLAVVAAPPPPDLQQHLGNLLASKVGGDMEFEVGGELFMAHRYILAARSSVFMAELFGPMEAKATGHLRVVRDMEARVFRCMLHFIYTDSLQEINVGDRAIMAQHLLVAADRYDLQRLKLICEDMLRSSMDISIAETTLVLAEQHACQGLKAACFEYLKAPGNLKAVMATDGFQHLKTSCSSLLEELLAQVAP